MLSIWGFFSSFSINWGTPIDLSSRGENAEQFCIATNNSLEALAVWIRSEASNNIIEAASLNGYWNSPVELSDRKNTAELPQVALNESGIGFAIWSEFNGIYYFIKVSRYDGNSWEKAETLTRTKALTSHPQISLNDSGDGVAVWEIIGNTDTIQASVYRESNSKRKKWSSPVIISAGENAFNPKVKMSNEEIAIAIWEELDSSCSSIQSAVFIKNKWSDTETLSLEGCDSKNPEIAMDYSGEGIAIWESTNENSLNVIQTARFTFKNRGSKHGWNPAENLSDNREDSGRGQIALNDFGYAVAIWEHYEGANTVLKAATCAGEIWSSPETISYVSEKITSANVKINPENIAVTIWQAYNGYNWVIESNTHSGGWEGIQVLSISEKNAYEPKVAINEKTTSAIWKYFDGSHSVIQTSMGQLN